ncbi:MAG: threonylcarbamoyl-AMP synthase [Deltaproteobacteria bacterium]|nr:threonylcarbamoyl-AMP synthase [Deltaproteobacteria bacterium]MBW2305477.1 threonylcarbamoyl-AMP synthase [Deltaproteobacteria bacterium]
MKRNESLKIFQTGPGRDPDVGVEKAARAIRAGGLVAYPTETFYGLGADIFSPESLEKVFLVKGRDHSKPLMVCVDHPHSLDRLVNSVPKDAAVLIDRFWPGPLTLLLPARRGLHPALTGGKERVGVRVPGHPVARNLAARTGNPITATSANRSNKPGLVQWEHVVEELGWDVDMVLAWSEILPGVGSTIIDLCESEPLLIRTGIVSPEEIQSVLGRPLKKQKEQCKMQNLSCKK